ncbi:Transcription factor MYC/MYB N-terminal protein [Dioscorea alata]|uniref:Transcription factor MYC/MYB N-terminal protein n=1 Tax=Dioscorea alata TaxID=55571 RepID=A0ACB7VZC8_DIOAL|nr:Transcription factor MYC/MYB N-terminal protein [Dioscorea alata]
MGFLLRDALRRLCVEIGWSYAVFWRAIGCRNPKKLVWEDGHCERLPSISGFDAMDMLLKEKGLTRGSANDWYAEIESQAEDKLGMLFKKMMVSQVHVVGEGVVGRAVLTGHHQWILRDKLGLSSSDISAEMKAQFFAGIQTIAIIPVLPFGVVQLGSTQMVIENIGFINHVRCLFAQLGSVSGTFTSDVTQKAFSKNSILQASPAVPDFTCLSGEFGAQAVSSLPAISGRVFHQPDQRSTSLRIAKQPCGSTSVDFNVKSDYGVSKVTLANMATATTQAIYSKMLLQDSDTIVKPGHPNNQLECHASKAQVSPIDYSIRFNQQASEYSSCSGFENNSLAATSDLHSSSLAVSAKVPTPSNGGPLEKKSTISNSESVQTRYSRSKSSYQQTGSDVGSFYDREGQFSGHAFGETSSYPAESKVKVKTSHDNPSGNGRNFMTNNKINNLDGKQVISEDSMSTHFMEKDFQKIVAAGRKDSGNDLFQCIDVLPAEFGKYGASYDPLGTLSQSDCWTSSSNPFEEKQRFLNGESIANSQQKFLEEPCFMGLLDGKSAKLIQSGSGDDLFDALGIQYKSSHYNAHELDTDVSTCITSLDTGPFFDSLNHENSCTDIFLENYHDQLLDAVVSKAKSGAKQNSDDDVSCRTSITNISSSSFRGSSSASGRVASSGQTGTNFSDPLTVLSKSEPAIYNTGKSAGGSDKTEECSMRSEPCRTPIIPWMDNGRNIKSGRASSAQCKRVDDIGKLTRKRARPGENPRPRPKDRQMIQDRVKELREIVPNGAKCSIDALLEKTIKHMLFLQSVTKHADKLKETGEPKIISKEGGLLLKDSFESGATWAFEVGNQSMICPIIVEDLNTPRQMLVEMLCEERGFFLEIADLIRGMGLTILKGVMESRDDKIWARFVAEANRDVTRMEIFLSLVHLLEPTMGSHITPAGVNNLATPQMPAPPPSMPATVISDSLV